MRMKMTKRDDVVTISPGKKLKGNAFYLDDDGDVVLTDCDGYTVAVLLKCESGVSVLPPEDIVWPLRESDITSVTLSLEV